MLVRESNSTCCVKCMIRVCRQYPKAVMLPTEGLYSSPLSHIPHPDCLILASRNNKLMLRMEKRTADIVEMSTTSINLPSLGLTHPPKFHLSIVGCRNNEG